MFLAVLLVVSFTTILLEAPANTFYIGVMFLFKHRPTAWENISLGWQMVWGPYVTILNFKSGRHSSVVSSVPSIL